MSFHVQLSENGNGVIEQVRTLPGVRNVDQQTDRISVRLDEEETSLEDFHDQLHNLGARIRMFQPEAMDMETAFMKLTEGKTA